MPKINTYTNNASIEDNDKLLTYDTGAGATKLTLFSTIKDWMLARMAAVTSRTAGSSDDILTVNNGTVGKSTMSSVAKSMVEDYTGSSLGGSTRSVKAAIDATTTALSTLEQETDDAITDLRDDLNNSANLFDVVWTDEKFVSRSGGLSYDEKFSYAEISLLGIKKIRFMLNSTNANVSYCTKNASGQTVFYGYVHTPTFEWVEHDVTDTETLIRITCDTNLKDDFKFYCLPDYSREEINAIQKNIIDVKHNANWPTIDWTDGKYVSKQGALSSQPGYSYCDISLSGIKKIRFCLNSISPNVSYCTKNASGQTVFYGYVHTPTFEWVEHTVTDTETSIRITCDTNLKDNFFCYFQPDYSREEIDLLTSKITNVETTVSKIASESYMDVEASNILWSSGRYDSNNGNEYASAATFRITIDGTTLNYVTYCLRSGPLSQNTLYIKGKGENVYFYLSAWDENNNYIGVYDLTSNTFKTSYDNNRITSVYQSLRIDELYAMYPNYTWKITAGDITNSSTALNPSNVDNYIYFSVSAISYLNDKMSIVKDGGFCRIFKKIGCIGDSLSSGAFEYKENGTNKTDFIYEFSWGQYLARMCGNSVINFSTGGLTTRTWLTSEYCTQMMSGGDKLCDCYTIALGVNDLKTDERNVPVGTIEDIDLQDYTKNSDTYYGNMGGIIQRIKSVQPRAKIFLITNPGRNQSERTAAVPYNTALSNVCGIFTDVYLVDLYSLGLFDQRYMLASHYGSNGYLKAAWDISSLISAIIEDNPTEFKEVAFIGTNKTWA